MPDKKKEDGITLEDIMGKISAIEEKLIAPKTDSQETPEGDKPNPAVDAVTNFLRDQVSAKTDSDVKDWNLDQLFGAFSAIQKMKKELPDAPKAKMDSDDDIPDILKANLPKPGEVRG